MDVLGRDVAFDQGLAHRQHERQRTAQVGLGVGIERQVAQLGPTEADGRERLTGTDTGSYSFTWTGKKWSSGHAVAVSGAVSSGDPFEAVNRASSASGNAFPVTTVTTTSAPLLLWIGRNDEPTSAHTPPADFTEIQDRDCTTLAYRRATAPGTFSARGATYTGTANPLQAVLLAIRS